MNLVNCSIKWSDDRQAVADNYRQYYIVRTLPPHTVCQLLLCSTDAKL